jgi:hypothetical protein
MARRTPIPALAWGACAWLCLASAGAMEVWKWTDPQGVTHYGSAPPDDPRARAERIDLPDTTVSESDRRAAAWRLAREKAQLERAGTGEPVPAGRARAASAPTACEAALRRYEESAACFARYRYGRGLVRPQAYQHCTEVPAPPDDCR